MRTAGRLGGGMAALTVLVGCAVPGGGSGGGGAPTGNLGEALATVPAGHGAEESLYFSDLALGEYLGEGLTKAQLLDMTAASALGLGRFATFSQVDPEAVPAAGSDPATAITIGFPPDESYRFTGMDPDAVYERFAHYDSGRSTLGDGELLVRREDHGHDLTDPLGQPAALGMYNTVWWDEDVLVGATAEAPVRAWVEPESTLAAEGTYDAVTECLGEEVVGAWLGTEGLDGGPFDTADRIDTLAIGHRPGREATSSEEGERDTAGLENVLCLEAADATSAQEIADGIRTDLEDGGTSSVHGQPWTDILVGPVIEVEGRVVELAVGGHTATLHDLVLQGDLPALTDGEVG